jgi:hypothetical protein
MKNIILSAVSATLLLIGFSACETAPANGPMVTPNVEDLLMLPCSDHLPISRDELPAPALDYLADNFPNAIIERAYEIRLPRNIVVFGVRLSDGNEALFSADGGFISSSDGSSVTLNIADLPGMAIQYLNNNYPNWTSQSIQIELDDDYGQAYLSVRLNNGTEIIFDADGQWLCGGSGVRDDDDCDDDDDDDCDDDDDDNNGQCRTSDLLNAVRPWLDANLDSYQIKDIECEDFCDDDDIQIEVELRGVEEEYYFDLDGNFLYTEVERHISIIPQNVLNAVENLYPNFRFEDDEAYVLTYADGTLAYEFEIEVPGDDDDIELIVDENGNIICIDED